MKNIYKKLINNIGAVILIAILGLVLLGATYVNLGPTSNIDGDIGVTAGHGYYINDVLLTYSDVDAQQADAALTSISGLTYVSPSYIKLTANDTYAVRTLAEVKTDLSLNNVTNDAQIAKSIGTAQGDLIYFTASTTPTVLAKGTAAQVLTMNAGATAPEWAAGGGGYTNLTSFVEQTAWRVFYSNTAGDVVELALGADGTYLKSNGAAAAPTFAVPAGAGDVSKVGTPADSQIGVWTGDGTIEGAASLTYDGANLLFTGDIGKTDGKITKGWFTDLTVTNAIAGSITGNAATITIADESADTTCFPLFVTAATGDLAGKSGTNLIFNSNTGILTATGFAGALTGNVTGDASGSSGSCTGNSATVTGFTPASGSLTLSGANALTLTTTAATDVTLPTTGTLATTGKLDQFAATTSAELAGVISDEIGAGKARFDTSVTAKTTTATLNVNEAGTILCSAAGGAYTITLPTASGNTGLQYHFIKTDANYTLITLDGNGAETFNYENATSAPVTTYPRLNTYCAEVTIISDGTNWQVIDEAMGQVPVCDVYLVTTQENVSNATNQYVDFDTENYDIGSNYDTGTITGAATTTSASHLVDTTDPPFASWMVGKRIKDVTGGGYTYITAYNSTSDVTVRDNIFGEGDDYLIQKSAFTAPISGYYLYSGSIRFQDQTADQGLSVDLFVNDAWVTSARAHPSSTNYFAVGQMKTIHLNKDDICRAKEWNGQGADTLDIYGSVETFIAFRLILKD